MCVCVGMCLCMYACMKLSACVGKYPSWMFLCVYVSLCACMHEHLLEDVIESKIERLCGEVLQLNVFVCVCM